MNDTEYAQMEAAEIHYSDRYFDARRGIESGNSRDIFKAGFQRGYDCRKEVSQQELADFMFQAPMGDMTGRANRLMSKYVITKRVG